MTRKKVKPSSASTGPESVNGVGSGAASSDHTLKPKSSTAAAAPAPEPQAPPTLAICRNK